MNILSLFDGLGGAREALSRTNIKVDNYYASEIDKYAIQVANKNYPDIIQLGNVEKVCKEQLMADDKLKIDLLIGGSPCQGFSYIGNRLNFDDPRSTLFFYYVRLLKMLKPKWFLLENVKMKKDSIDIISLHLDTEPVEINSSLVSAQHRKRLYWTNIPVNGLPKDKGLVIKDILQYCGIPATQNYKEYVIRDDKSTCIDSNYWKGKDNHGQRTIVIDCCEVGKAKLKGHDFLKRVYCIHAKCPTLTAVCGGNQERKIAIDERQWRKLTPVECERLQTLPDNYTEGCSNTQRYKMIGNGFTIDVVAWILNQIKEN